MKSDLSRAMALLVPAIVFYAGPAWGQYTSNLPPKAVGSSYYEGAAESRYLSVADTREAAPKSAAASSCGCASGACNSCPSDGCRGSWTGCEDCPSRGIVLFSGFESWRGFADGAMQNNNGANVGFNLGTGLGPLADYGIGFQFGGSYGVYDWNGRSFPGGAQSENNQAQEQVFITTGLFRKADGDWNWSAGIAYDWMINNNFGVYSNEPFLGQWRGQVSYALSAYNELGIWGALRDRGDTQVTSIAPGGTVSFRSVDQCNFFYHRKFDQGTDGWIWFGFLDHTKLGPLGGSLGDFIVGGTLSAPISDRLALYTNVQYMHPSSRPGDAAASEETWDIGFGIAFYPNCNARTRSVSGSCWMPLMPVANNGSFMVDASQNAQLRPI